MRRLFLLGLLSLGLLPLAGCNKDPGLVPVSGRVTFEGKPVKEVIVNFQPAETTPGNGALGGTDADGRFTLTDSRGQRGAYAGEYKVLFYPALPAGVKEGDAADVVGGRVRGRSIPEIYLNVNSTPLRATVPAGGCTVEVILTKTGAEATTKVTPR
jgi:hypothetical protein